MMIQSAVIKVYLPNETEGKYLYGFKKIEPQSAACCSACTSYFVISCSDKEDKNADLELLGTLGGEVRIQDGISLLRDRSGKIFCKFLQNGKDISNHKRVLLLRFVKNRFLKSYEECYDPKTTDDNFALFIAKALKTKHDKENGQSFVQLLCSKSHSLLATTSSITSKVLQPFSPIFKNTVIYQHCSNWRKCLNDERSKNGFFILDVLLGVLFFLLLNHVQHSGRYFMGCTEFVVHKLRKLLEMLDGSPVGLKLNVQLNNFLLSCFMYHVDLWWNFIVIIEPAIHYLFLPISMFGLLGFSFQCAVLCDVITLITLHAHCFYIYAAMLYKLELTSIRSLLRIVLGRRLNVLKSTKSSK